jgi:hypothetical protein
MRLSEYFDKRTGHGFLATAGSDGKVDIAVYARPHFMDEETVAFIMADRLTHKNLRSNPHAAYLFMEPGKKFVGKRLYLKKVKEEKDSPLIDALRRRKIPPAHEAEEYKTRYLVYFHIDKVLPLLGDGE